MRLPKFCRAGIRMAATSWLDMISPTVCIFCLIAMLAVFIFSSTAILAASSGNSILSRRAAIAVMASATVLRLVTASSAVAVSFTVRTMSAYWFNWTMSSSVRLSRVSTACSACSAWAPSVDSAAFFSQAEKKSDDDARVMTDYRRKLVTGFIVI